MDVEHERVGSIQILRINRPDARNAMNGEVISGIGLGMEEADADPEVRAIVLTGTGDRAFCAGMDLRAFAEGARDSESPAARRGAEAFGRFIRQGTTKPVIGAANATAVAGGFELLLACDMVVSSSGAKFGLPEVKRALVPAGGGVFLGSKIPLAIALELTLTGDLIDAHRALSLGLVNSVVEPDRVVPEAIALAERISSNGPLAVSVTKRLVHLAASRPAAEVWDAQDEAVPAVFASEDAKEGATAFVERRDPIWRGC